jgi:hypothetical protein
VHDEAVRGGAGLADVAELREHRAVDGLVEVGVVEDDERALPPSSIDTRTPSAAWAMSFCPAGVEPESLRRRGSAMIGPTPRRAVVVTTLTTPGGQARLDEQSTKRASSAA